MMNMVKMIKQYKKEIIEFIKFNIVGVANTLVDFAVFTLLSFFGLYFMIAQIISYSCGVVNSFVMNKYWTFAKKGMPVGSEVMRFIFVNIISLGVSLIILYPLKPHFGLYGAKIIATLFSMLVNFAGNKLWVFR